MKSADVEKANDLLNQLQEDKGNLNFLKFLSDNGTKKYKVRIDKGAAEFFINVDLRPSIEELTAVIENKTKELIKLGIEF